VAVDEAFRGTDRGEARRGEVAARMPSEAAFSGRADGRGEQPPETRTTSRSSSGVVARLVSKLNFT